MSLAAFIRKIPRDLLLKYFAEKKIVLPAGLECAEASPKEVTQALETIGGDTVSRVVSDAERVGGLSDEAGQTALYAVADASGRLDALAGGHPRALWLYLNEPDNFRHAEDIRYTDDRRYGRYWDGFVGKSGIAVGPDDPAVEAFREAVRRRFQSRNVHVDVFHRQRRQRGDAVVDLIQATVYREGRLNQMLEFDNRGALGVRDHYPVIEASLTYEPNSGNIEVVAGDRQTREDFVGLFSRELLGQEPTEERLQKRPYDIQRLCRPFDFPTDAGDGIASVRLTSLRMMPADTASQRLTLECTRGEHNSIWQMADARFGGSNPLNGGWLVTQAKLTILFHTERGSRAKRSLPVTITMPNGCDLKDRTERERLIGEKYLRRWALVPDS